MLVDGREAASWRSSATSAAGTSATRWTLRRPILEQLRKTIDRPSGSGELGRRVGDGDVDVGSANKVERVRGEVTVDVLERALLTHKAVEVVLLGPLAQGFESLPVVEASRCRGMAKRNDFLQVDRARGLRSRCAVKICTSRLSAET